MHATKTVFSRRLYFRSCPSNRNCCLFHLVLTNLIFRFFCFLNSGCLETSIASSAYYRWEKTNINILSLIPSQSTTKKCVDAIATQMRLRKLSAKLKNVLPHLRTIEALLWHCANEYIEINLFSFAAKPRDHVMTSSSSFEPLLCIRDSWKQFL